MDKKLECLKLALEYAKLWNEYNPNKMLTEQGIISFANVFYNFVSDEKNK